MAIALLAAVKGVVWSIVLPPWYGPDEASHYAYVQVMVEDHWLAHDHDPNAGLYYPPEIGCSEINLDVGVVGPFHSEPPFGVPWVYCTEHSPADRHAVNPTNAAGGYSPIYYAAAIPYYLAAWPLNVDSRVRAVRLWSVTLGVAAAVMTYLAASWAFAGDRRLAAAAAVLFTLQPMLSQQTAVVNNDALLIAFAAGFWWRYMRALRVGLTVREAALMGALVGLAYLAKQQGALLGAAMPVLLVYGPQRPRFDAGRVVRLLAAAAAPALAAAVVGELLLIAAHSSEAITSAAGTHTLHDYITVFEYPRLERAYFLYVTGFWGFFGWFQVALPNLVYVLITVIVAMGLLGLALILVRDVPGRRLVWATLLPVIVCGALLQLTELYVYLSSGQLILQGRSFLLLLTPLVILLMWGWMQLAGRRASAAVAPVAILAASALNLVSLFVMIEAFFG